MKKVILFWPGSSGHFLAEFMASENTTLDPQFRLDLGAKRLSAVFAETLPMIKTAIATDTRETVLSHHIKISDLSDFYETNWIKKIYPKTNLIGLLKNIFYKKQQVENVDWTYANHLIQFDGYFENLKTWYERVTQDTDLPDEHIVDFGQLHNIDFLVELYTDFYRYPPNQRKMDFALGYIDKQFDLINDTDSKIMEDIIKHVAPTTLFDVALVLFLYEKNHLTVDRNRLWTIDDLPNDLDSALTFLTKNAKSYTIF